MADTAAIRRSRGGVTGVLLILLGAWGALIPFVGPYIHFAYSPDKAWRYTSGRLWLEIVPGAAAVLGGVVVLTTRSRLAGWLGGLLAALGGAWFVTGTAITAQFLKSAAISPGAPVGSSSLRLFLEGMGFFTGTGVVIVFLAALAAGRFSVPGTGTDPRFWDGGLGQGGADAEQYPTQEQFPTMAGDYPPGSTQPGQAEVTAPPEMFSGPQQQQFTSPAGQYPPPTTGQFPASSSPFPPSGPAEAGGGQA